MHSLGFREFWALLGFAPPRYALVRDGKPEAIWDFDLPSPAEVERVRATLGPYVERKESGVPQPELQPNR